MRTTIPGLKGLTWYEADRDTKLPGSTPFIHTPAPGATPYEMKISQVELDNNSFDPCSEWSQKGKTKPWRLLTPRARIHRLRLFIIQQKLAEIQKANLRAEIAEEADSVPIPSTPKRSTKPRSTRSAQTISTTSTPTGKSIKPCVPASEPQMVPTFGPFYSRVGGGAYPSPVVYNGLDQAVIPQEEWTNMKSLMGDVGAALKLQTQLSQHVQQLLQQQQLQQQQQRQDGFEERLRELERKM